MQYVPELTWILFLRILDEREEIEAEESRAVGADFRPSLAEPFRWRDWAAPSATQRQRLTESTTNAFYDFVNERLIPHLKNLQDKPNATPRQKVISEIMSGVDRTRIDTQRNLLDVLDKIHDISLGSYDDTHVFALSQIYEGLLLKMGEKGNDGGSSSRPGRSSGPWSMWSPRAPARRCATLAAARAVFWPRPSSSCASPSATRLPATRSTN